MAPENSPQLILSKRDFNRRVRADKAFREQIAGFSSFSLTHAHSCLTEGGFSVLPFSPTNNGLCLYAEIQPSVYRQVFGKKNKVYLDSALKERLGDNRAAYGLDGAVIEYFMNQPNAPDDFRNLPAGLVNWMNMAMRDLRENGISLAQIVSGEYRAKAYFETIEDFENTVIDLSPRGGIQAIYGDTENLTEFLKGEVVEEVDDCAVCIQSPIPTRLVMALIPLGKYEEEALLNPELH